MYDCPEGASEQEQRTALMGNPAVLLAPDNPFALAIKGYESGNTHGQGGEYEVFDVGLFEYFMTQFLVIPLVTRLHVFAPRKPTSGRQPVHGGTDSGVSSSG